MSLDPTREQSPNGASRRLFADLPECVACLANVVAKGMEELVAPHGFIPLEFALLRAFLQKEEWTATELAQLLPVKLSRISRVVTKLVDRDLLRRRRLRSDRRVVALALTEEGKALTLELHRSVQAYDARLSEGVSEEELAAFASVLSKVMANYTALQSRRNGSH